MFMSTCGSLVVFLLTLPEVSTQMSVTMQQNVSTVGGACAEIDCAFRIPDFPSFPSRLRAQWLATISGNTRLEAVFDYNFSSRTSDRRSSIDRADFRGKPEKGDCSLRINDARKSDEGSYLFTVDIYTTFPIATLRTGSSQSFLTVWEKPRISVGEGLIAGQRARLICSIPDSCSGDRLELKWIVSVTAQDRKVEGEVVSEGPGTRMLTSALTFTPSPAHHRESLGCAVLAKGVQKAKETITMDVKQLPEKPTVNWSVVAMEGSSISLNCRSWETNPVTLRWLRNGEDIGTSSTGELQVLLRDVTSVDEGKYWCSAVNDVGVSNSSTSVSVQYRPKTEMACTSTGTVTNCVCKVRAHPPANVSWSIDGEALAELKSEDVVVARETVGNVIQSSVKLTRAERMGNVISCSAGNTHGYSASEYPLRSEGTDVRTIYWTAGGVGAGLVILIVVLWTTAVCRKQRRKAAAVPELSVVYSTVTPSINFLESRGVGDSSSTQRDEIVYADINFQK